MKHALFLMPIHAREKDYHTGLKYGLEIYCPVGDDGRARETSPLQVIPNDPCDDAGGRKHEQDGARGGRAPEPGELEKEKHRHESP